MTLKVLRNGLRIWVHAHLRNEKSTICLHSGSIWQLRQPNQVRKNGIY